MAGIINSIITRFTSVGADDVVNDSTRVGRAQTRLGQTSASAGRQFAAQASGLGGLVAAYAGAAATTFALTAAFDALARSARAAQTVQGLDTLAGEIGASGQELLGIVRELTKSQLTITESAAAINLSLSAGFNTEQIAGLSTVALKASRALGRDLNDAYTRVVRGSAKLETELLDELGIYTKIDPATRAYAAAIGKSASELTEFERRQAFVNSVIEEGNRKFKSINTTIPTAAEQIEAFGVKIQDLTTQIGILIAEALAPLAAFLTNNLAGALSAVGVILSLVAGKGITLLKAGAVSLTTSIQASGLAFEGFTRKITGTATAAATATAAVKSLNAATIALSGSQKNTLIGLQATANERKLSSVELRQSTKLVQANIAALNQERQTIRNTVAAQRANQLQLRENTRLATDRLAAARAMSQGGGFGTSEFAKRTAAIRAANKELATATTAEAAFRNTITQTRASIQANTQALLQNRAALAALTPAASGAAFAISSFGVAASRAVASFVSGYTTLLTGLIGLFSRVFFGVTLFTLIGSSIAGALGKGKEFEAVIKNIGNTLRGVFNNEDAKTTASVIQGISATNFENLEKADSLLRDIDEFKFKKKFLTFDIEVVKTKEELVTEVNSLLTDVALGTQKSVASSLASTEAVIGSVVGNIAAGLVRFIPGIGPIVAPVFGGTISRAIATAVGAGLGAIWDFTSGVPEVPLELRNKIRDEFSAALVGIDESTQDKIAQVIATIRDRYEDAARIDPAARVALKTMERLVLSSAAYLDNIDAIAGLMLATGQTADIIATNFTFEKAINDISFLQAAITKIGNTRFEFRFVDIESEAFQNIIATPVISVDLDDDALRSTRGDIISSFTTLSEDIQGTGIFNLSRVTTDSLLESVLGSIESGTPILASSAVSTLLDDLKELAGLTDAEITTIANSFVELQSKAEESLSSLRKGPAEVKDSFLELTGSINLYQESTIRAVEVLRQLNSGLSSGSIDLERFEQQFNNLSTATLVAERQFGRTQSEIEGLRALINTEQDTNRQKQLTDALNILEAQRDNILEQSLILKDQLGIFKERGEILKTQLEFTNFFKSFESSFPNILQFDLDIRTAGFSDLEKFLGTIGFLQQGIRATETELALFNNTVAKLNELALSENEEQLILSTGADSINELASSLDALDGVFAKVSGTGESATLVITTGFAEAGNEVSKTITATELAASAIANFGKQSEDAIRNFVKKSFAEIPKLVDDALRSIKDLRSEIEEELSSIAIERRDIKFNAVLDTQEFETNLALVKARAELETLRLRVQLVDAKVDAGTLTASQGAIQENVLQKEILNQRREIINLEFKQANDAIDRKAIEAGREAGRQEAIIRQQAEAQRQKVIAEQEYINAIVKAYNDIFTVNKQVNDDFLTGLVANGNVVADTLSKTFATGATALNSAIVAALNKEVISTPNVSGGVGVPALTADISSILPQTLDVYNTKVESILSDITDLENARLDAVDEGFDAAIENLKRERTLEEERHKAKLGQLSLEGQIEAQRAQERINSAKKAGGGSDEETKGRIDDLTGSFRSSLESAFMGINNYILYGEGNLTDVFVQLLQGIQREIINKVFIEPISDLLANQISSFVNRLIPNDVLGDPLSGPLGGDDKSTATSLLGQSIGSAGTNAANAILGAANQVSSALTQLGTSAQNGVGTLANNTNNAGARIGPAFNQLGNTTQLSVSQLANSAQNSGGTLNTAVQSTAGVVAQGTQAAAVGVNAAGNTFTAALSSFWPILLLMGLTSIINRRAAGGAIQRAAGGEIPQLAGGGMMRDRVPALLEPGEFVIRRPIARAVGVPALQSLNATGQMSNQPSAPVINFTNTGSEKDVEAGPPRFDGERYVIDIITRDLRNNGPIRKSLRGGI